MSSWAWLIYSMSILIFILYLIYKLYKRNYLFSCFNISLFVYFFTILISPVFYYMPESWSALGVVNYKQYYPYLDKCLLLNAGGFIVTIITMLCFEFTKKHAKVNSIYSVSSKLNDSVLKGFFWFVIILWYAIVFVYNHGLPLLNGGRTFYMNTSISPVYLFLNELILLYSLYFGVCFAYKKSGLFQWLVCLATLAFAGNRGTFLISALVPIMLILIYIGASKKCVNANADAIVKIRLKTFFKIILILFVVMVLGLLLQSVRNGGTINISSMLNELICGNTFSDIRDGAYILKGFDAKFNGNYLYGKTYFAGLISFIPSSMSAFRLNWSWGRFSTTALFGWENHAGLRGGNLMEAYINFGVVGVIGFAVLQGILYGFLEKYFYIFLIKGKVKYYGKEFIVLYVISSVANLIVCTSGMFNLYTDIIFLILIILISKSLGKKAHSFKRVEINKMSRTGE